MLIKWDSSGSAHELTLRGSVWNWHQPPLLSQLWLSVILACTLTESWICEHMSQGCISLLLPPMSPLSITIHPDWSDLAATCISAYPVAAWLCQFSIGRLSCSYSDAFVCHRIDFVDFFPTTSKTTSTIHVCDLWCAGVRVHSLAEGRYQWLALLPGTIFLLGFKRHILCTEFYDRPPMEF